MFRCINSHSFITKPNGTIVSFLQKQESFLGYDEASMIGRNIIQYVPPNEQNDIIWQLNAVKKVPFSLFDCNIIAKDNSINHMNMIIYKFELNNEIYLSVCIAGACDERLISEIMSNIKSSTMEDLILGIMHEINNPNNFLMLNIPYLNQIVDNLLPIAGEYSENHSDYNVLGLNYESLKADITDLMTDVYEGINRIKKITSSLTDLLGVNSSNDKSNLLELIDDVIKNYTFAFNEKNISIDICKSDFECIDILCDHKNIKKAISNIIMNAIESFENSTQKNKKISFSFNLSFRSKSLSLIIEDNGVGISQSNLIKVFNPFFTTRRDKSQLGLGLYLTRYIIENNGGNIYIESKEGEWTKVFIRLSYKSLKENISNRTK